jgi:hypothetical protein
MAQVIFFDGKRESFKAVHIAKEGVYTGRIINQDEFVSGGFIPKENIKHIRGGVKKKILKRKS